LSTTSEEAGGAAVAIQKALESRMPEPSWNAVPVFAGRSLAKPAEK
jgi:hypothetical protein